MTHAARHALMLLPYDPPPPAEGGRLPPPPSLWQRARDFLAGLTARIAPLSAFAARTLDAAEQRDLLDRLEPIEKLVRALLILRAVTFLLMTPDGRRLMRDTPKSPAPEKPLPPGARDSHVLTIPHPGWSTIAQHHAASAARDTRAGRRAATAQSDAAACPSTFRICAWRFPKDETAPPQPTPKTLPSLALLCDAPLPGLATRRQNDEPEALNLARRIAALARALASPARPAMRLARWFARLPREALQGLAETFIRVRAGWRHGVEEACAAAAYVRRATRVLLHPEPG
jgi:hypothetical protein